MNRIATPTLKMPRQHRRVQIALWLVVALCGVCVLESSAHAAQTVALNVKLRPDRVGANATVAFGFKITAGGGGVPSPLLAVNLQFPERLSLSTSTLGLATCTERTLLDWGPAACPPNSRMGFGKSVSVLPIANELIYESATINILMGPPQHEHTVLLLNAEGVTPVAAYFVFDGEIRPAAPPYGESMHTLVPVVQVLPEGPDASTVSFHSTLGPEHLTYVKSEHGKEVPYTPRGLLVPHQCPRGGFPVRGEFRFQDGTAVTAKTRIACPPGSHSG